MKLEDDFEYTFEDNNNLFKEFLLSKKLQLDEQLQKIECQMWRLRQHKMTTLLGIEMVEQIEIQKNLKTVD